MFPEGTLGALLYYDHSYGDEFYVDGLKVSDAFNVRSNIGVYRLTYYFDIGGPENGAFASICQPFGDVMIDGAGVGNNNISASGLGDTVISAAYARQIDPTFYMGGVFYVSMPTGEYDRDDFLNIGTNRWMIRPTIAFAKRFGKMSPFSVECYANMDFFTDNDDYTGAGLTQKKAPIFAVDTHFVMDLDPASFTFVSLDYLYEKGGETEVEGVKQGDEIENHWAQLTFSTMLSQKFQIMLKYKAPLEIEYGNRTHTFGLRICYILSSPSKPNP